MLKNKKIFTLILATLILVLGVFLISYIPKKIISIHPSEVSKIEIFDGNRGEQVIVSNEKQKDHIISNLNNLTFRKGKLSIGYMGYKFRMTIYDEKGGEYKEILINSKDKIRYRGFFYNGSGIIDVDYINNIFETNQ